MATRSVRPDSPDRTAGSAGEAAGTAPTPGAGGTRTSEPPDASRTRTSWCFGEISWLPSTAIGSISRRASTASSRTVTSPAVAGRSRLRSFSSWSSRAWAKSATPVNPSEAELPLSVWAMRKTVCRTSPSSGWRSRESRPSSIVRRFSSVSAMKVSSRASASNSIAGSELRDPGVAEVCVEDQLAARAAADVLRDDGDAEVLEELEGHPRVLLAEVPFARLEGLEHAGAAEDLGLEAGARRAERDEAVQQLEDRDVAEPRRSLADAGE